MKNYILTFVFSALSLLATAQTFNEKFFNDFEKVYQKDPVQYIKNDIGSDFTIVYGDGRLGDKESVLKIYEALNQVSRTVTELKTRQLGNTGIATGILNHTYTSKKDGSPRDYTNRFTHTFTLQKGKWHLAAVHLTDIATAQKFDEKNLTDFNKGLEKDPIGYLKANAAPDYLFIYNGHVTDLTAVLHRFEILNLVSWQTTDVKVRQYGTTAVATGTVKHSYNVKADGTSVTFSDLFTYTFAYQGGKWLLLGGQHSDIPIDLKQEEAAIKAVLEGETKAFHAGDATAMLSNWHLTPTTRAVGNTTTGQTVYGEGDAIAKFYATVKPDNHGFSNSNYLIKINGKTAWASYDQMTTDPTGKTLFQSREMRCLDNVNGVWKIALLSSHQYKP